MAVGVDKQLCKQESQKFFFSRSLEAVFCRVPLPKAEEETVEGGARPPLLKPVQVSSCWAGM